jgi:hypothetical protein
VVCVVVVTTSSTTRAVTRARGIDRLGSRVAKFGNWHVADLPGSCEARRLRLLGRLQRCHRDGHGTLGASRSGRVSLDHHHVTPLVLYGARHLPHHWQCSHPPATLRIILLLSQFFWLWSLSQCMTERRGGAVCPVCARSSPPTSSEGGDQRTSMSSREYCIPFPMAPHPSFTRYCSRACNTRLT